MYLIPFNKTPGDVQWLIQKKLDVSRFSCRMEEVKSPVKRRLAPYCLKISTVRLRKKKDYCGAHAGPCVVNPFREGKHKHACWLEGVDWVAFSHMINSVCDDNDIDADFWSQSFEFKGKMWIRRGKLRRVAYRSIWIPNSFSFNGGNEVWDTKVDDDDFENRIGKESDIPKYPAGTPGIPEYDPEKAEAWEKEYT